MSTDELENYISPDDLRDFVKYYSNETRKTDFNHTAINDTTVPDTVDCFGIGPLTNFAFKIFNMKPGSSEDVNTNFYFSSREQPQRVQVLSGSQFGLEWVDFKPSRKTIVIVHGFMSYSNASWVQDMTRAFLQWDDVNVIAVDWCGGGNTWKYWRAVANTRRVGSDVTNFIRQLMNETGAKTKDFHFIGHSLGAHISSYVSYHLGGIHRITGLDPAQPCFRTDDSTERLDASDADFVDVIHTNGRLLSKIGFGFPDPTGTADFYPNGGMKQPGCFNSTKSVWSKILPNSVFNLQQAICSHGRAYLLFTESLINTNCTFRAYRWNLTYEGVNASLKVTWDRRGSNSVMGIEAVGGNGLKQARGPYFVLTTEREPYCPTNWQRQQPQPDLLKDLRDGFRLDRSNRVQSTVTTARADEYADPVGREFDESTYYNTNTTEKSWYKLLWYKWFG